MVPYIINSRGEQERFSPQKVYRSARRVGASAKLAQKITQEISGHIYTGIKTSEIFKQVKKMLHRETPVAALRFSLKEAMKALGPTGFPFEKYICNIFQSWGYLVKANQIMSGGCCSGYEIDFTAQKDNLLKIGECKYHNARQGLVQIEVALANYARFLDIRTSFDSLKKSGSPEIKSILVTNTRFSSRAIQYSECMGVELLGWNYPKNKGLEHLIDAQNLYPITILPSFKADWGNLFSCYDMMLVKDVLREDQNKLAKKLKISKEELKPLLAEARSLIPQV
jgi:hypothetical protein